MAPYKKLAALEELQSDNRNANKGTERGQALLERSLQELGAGRSILVDRDGVTIAGNKTLERAAEIGLPIRVVETDGTTLVVVQRTDLLLDDPDDNRARRLAIADNRASEVGLAWDPAALRAEMDAGLPLDEFFTGPELAAILASGEATVAREEGLETDARRAAAAAETGPISRRGDIWVCGDHRVMCGDAAITGDMIALMGGQREELRAQLVLADPPPPVEGRWLEADDAAFLALTRRALRDGGAVCLIARPDTLPFWAMQLQGRGYALKATIALLGARAPDSGAIEGDFSSDYDLILYAATEGHRPRGGRQSDVWRMEERLAPPLLHPDQRPVEAYIRAIARATDPAGIVLDPHAGSGTILVACESTKRRARALEIAPEYVDLAVGRWSRFTGRDATREGDGVSWRALARGTPARAERATDAGDAALEPPGAATEASWPLPEDGSPAPVGDLRAGRAPRRRGAPR